MHKNYQLRHVSYQLKISFMNLLLAEQSQSLILNPALSNFMSVFKNYSIDYLTTLQHQAKFKFY